MDMIQCALCDFGCTNLFRENQSLEHYGSEEHQNAMVNYMCSKREQCDNILINLGMLLFEANGSLTSAAALVDKYRQLMQRITGVIVEDIAETNAMHINSAANHSSSLDRIYGGTESPARELIERVDRDPNYEHNRELHQAEHQLTTTAMNNLPHTMATLSTDGSANHRNQDPVSVNEQPSITQFPTSLYSFLATELDSKSISTDGYLIWQIEKIFEKIQDALSKKTLCVDSPPFETAMDGHRLWARLYPNGSTDRRYISLHVHLDSPFRGRFSGEIKLVLVDQRTTEPREHQIQVCSGEMNHVNDRLGFEKFIEKNLLHQADSPYICEDGSCCILVYTPQTKEQKFAHLPGNIRDALMKIS